MESVGFVLEERAEIVQRGEVGCGERSLAEGSCEVEEQGLGGAGLLVEAAGAGADGLAEGADGLGERDQGLGRVSSSMAELRTFNP